MLLRFIKTKIGLSLLIALIIISGAVAFKVYDSRPKTDIGSKISLIAQASVQNAIDSGNGTLPEWEKTLNSLVSTSSEEKIASLSDIAFEAEDLSATDRFSRDFFAEYIELKESGAPIDENTRTNLINDLLLRDYGSSDEEKTYTENDIYILDTDSVAALKKYGNQLSLVITKPVPKGYESELTIITRVNGSENSDELAKLSLNIAHYQRLLQDISALPVPKSLKTAHIALLNAVSALLQGVRGMASLEKDPIGATKMMQSYENGLNSVELPLRIIGAYFKSKGVTFSSSESGYLLIQ